MSIEEPAGDVGLHDNEIDEWFANLKRDEPDCCCLKGSACPVTHSEPLCEQCETYCRHYPVPGETW